MTRGTVGNAETLTVTFVDDAGNPVTPDGDVTWEISVNNRAPEEIVQEPADAVATGTFRIIHTPTRSGYYMVKATAIVGGNSQSIEATSREVAP
jgi:hypothetical protein